MCKICHHKGITVALPIETWRPAAKELPVRVKLFPPGQPEPRPSSKKFTGETRSLQDVASVAKQTPRKWRNGIHLPFSGCPMSSRLIDTSHSQKEVSESNLRVNRIVVGAAQSLELWQAPKTDTDTTRTTHHATKDRQIDRTTPDPAEMFDFDGQSDSCDAAFFLSFIHSFTQSSLIFAFSHLLTYSLFHSLIHSLTHSSIHPSLQSFIHSFIHAFFLPSKLSRTMDQSDAIVWKGCFTPLHLSDGITAHKGHLTQLSIP